MTRAHLLAVALVAAAALLAWQLWRLLGLADWSLLHHPFVVEVGLRRCLETAAAAGLLAACVVGVRTRSVVTSAVVLGLAAALLVWLLRPHAASFGFVSEEQADVWKPNELKLLGSGAVGVFVALLAWPRSKA